MQDLFRIISLIKPIITILWLSLSSLIFSPFIGAAGVDATTEAYTTDGTVENKWIIENNTLKLIGKQREIRKSISLRPLIKKRILPATGVMPQKEIKTSVETKAIVAASSQAVVITETERSVEHLDWKFSAVAKYYNKEGQLRWQRESINRSDPSVLISRDGNFVSLVIANKKEGCGAELDIDCKETLLVLDHEGNELINFGPASFVHKQGLSPNGIYGFACIEREILADTECTFFNSISGVRIRKDAAYRNVVRLNDSGVIDLLTIDGQIKSSFTIE